MLTLHKVPNLVDNQFWEHVSGDRTMNYVLWPADVGSAHVNVRISTTALSEYDGGQFTIDIEKIEAALARHRELIQQLARSKYRQGDSVVTLDNRDLPARFLFRLYVRIAARAARRRDHRHFTGLRRRHFDAGIDIGRADHAAALSEFFAQCLR
jgi:Protein of unknown function (DUF1488)